MELSTPQLFHGTFTDFEELTVAARFWNMEFSKLDPTPFHGELFQLVSPDLLIARGKFNSRLKQLGEPPIGFRTFTIPSTLDFWMYWRGREVNGSNLMAFPLNSELDTLSDSNFDIFTLSVLEDSLFELADKLCIKELKKFLKEEEVLQCDPVHMARLRHSLHQCATASRTVQPDAESMKNQLLIRLVQTLGTAKGDTNDKKTSMRRLKAIRATDRFLLEHPDEMPTIKDLCKRAQVSERTFEYAFHEYYGMHPKAYINAMRLNGARRELHSSSRVSDAANARGFWHMGQFAADYRKLFGENPSQTVKA